MSFNRLIRGIVLVLTLQVFHSTYVSAETVPRTLKELTMLALQYNAELVALEKEVLAKQSIAIQVGIIGNPTLELQGTTGSLSGSPEDRSFSIGINQELPLNSKLRLRRDVAQREAESLKRQRDNTARLLKDEVSTAALDLLLAYKRYELSEELCKLNRELVVVAEERFKAGDISELELNLAKVELARAETRLLEIERERNPHRIKLASLTGLSENDIEIYEKINSPKLLKTSQELVKLALSARPDLLALTQEREKAEIEICLAKAEALPNITAGLFAQWQRGITEVGGMSSVNSDTQVGVRLSMPITVFDRNQGGRAAARSRFDAAESRILNLERSIAAEVEAAVSRATASERILSMIEHGIIPQLTENLKLTREAYRIGEVGILAVIDEQKKFYEVSESYWSALHSKQQAFVKLESATATDFSGGVQ